MREEKEQGRAGSKFATGKDEARRDVLDRKRVVVTFTSCFVLSLEVEVSESGSGGV